RGAAHRREALPRGHSPPAVSAGVAPPPREKAQAMKKQRSGLLSAVALSGLSGFMVACAHGQQPRSEQALPLPLGPAGLTEKRESRQVAPGVTYTRIDRGQQSSQDVFTVDVAFKTDRA